MNVKFDNLYFIYLIPLLVAILILMWVKAKNITIMKKIFPLRAIVMIFIFIALLNPWLMMTSTDTETIFLVDRSESSKDKSKDYSKFIEDSLEYLGKDDSYSIVSFAANTSIEKTFDKKKEGVRFQGVVDSSSTDIPSAVKKAYGIFNEESNKRIVILSDGKNNSSSNKIHFPEDLEIKINKTEEFSNPEVQITSLDIPEKVEQKESFNIEVVIDSNVETKSDLVLYDGKFPVYSKKIYIKKGKNRFSFEDFVESSGLVEYKAEINPLDDTFIENNVFGRIIEVKGNSHILLISSKEDDVLSGIIEASGVLMTRTSIENLNTSIDYLSKFDGIIVNDISKWRMSNEFMKSIESYVKDLGKGILVVGGKESYSIGGYLDTDFERILPVRSEAVRESKENSMDMVIVIDKSGSMMGGNNSNIFLAKQAAAKVYRGLKPSDRLGIVVFDTKSYNVLPMGEEFDEEEVMMKIGGIDASGGTDILEGLKSAYDNLKTSTAKSKHIILVTDGQSSKDGIDKLIADCRNLDITISSIAIGNGSDRNLLKRISDLGHGRYYYLNNPQSIPDVFLKESEIMSKSYLNDRTIYPQVYYNTPQINFSSDQAIYGYISTTLKSSAETIIESDRKEAILAYWKYGLGDAFALTTDLSGNWTRDMIKSPENITAFIEIVKYIGQNKYTDSYQVSFKQNNESGGEIWIKDSNSGHDKTVKYSVQGEDISGELKYVGESKWKGSIDILSQGIHYLLIEDSDENKVLKAFEVNYPKEYNILENSNSIVGIEEIEKPSQVFLEIDNKNKKKVSLRNIILILAIIIFLIDILLRVINKGDSGKKVEINIKNKQKDSKIIKKEKVQEINKDKSTSSRLLEAKRKINK